MSKRTDQTGQHHANVGRPFTALQFPVTPEERAATGQLCANLRMIGIQRRTQMSAMLPIFLTQASGQCATLVERASAEQQAGGAVFGGGGRLFGELTLLRDKNRSLMARDQTFPFIFRATVGRAGMPALARTNLLENSGRPVFAVQ
ncbi:hypothetical protein D3C81_891690 [compost metagenome]